MDKYGIIGYPLGHSFSPQIHNPAFKKIGLQAHYDIYTIIPDNFDNDILDLKKSSVKGLNVTVPYKKKIIPFLDRIHTLAEKVGAVNTIKSEKGIWTGFNTDIQGFIKPISGKLNRYRNVLILGAGGAAYGICFALLEYGHIAELTILNRTPENAEQLKSRLLKYYTCAINTGSIFDNIKERYDLIVNTTNVGMGHLEGEIPFRYDANFHENTFVYDLIYNPEKTLFLKVAEDMHLDYINGLDMLIGQAQIGFEIWTGQKYPDWVIDKSLFYK